MKEIKEKLLLEAKNSLIEGNVNLFTKIIIELYNNHITCNCFFREQPEEYWQTLKTLIEKNKDDVDDFALNFAKGFIYLRGNEEKKAYIYLSKAIKNSPSNDIVYSLRAAIDKEINESNFDDAQIAIKLNPSASNYFRLAHVYDDELKELSIYEKVISLNKNFACAYYNSGNIYYRLKDYEKAMVLHLKCEEIQPNHFGALDYFQSSKNALLLNAIKEYKNKNYKESVIKFELLFKYDKSLSEDDAEIYLLAKIKATNPDINLDNENPYYITLDNLIRQYHEKNESRVTPTEDEINSNKLMQYKSEYRIGFGDYEGKKIADIISSDSEYILWCIINLHHFSVSYSVLIENSLRIQMDYLKAIEINIIKTKLLKDWGSYKEDNRDYNDYGEGYSDRDNFDALTDGQLGDWDDFGGDIDDARAAMGLD